MCRVTVAAWLCKRFVVGAVLSVEEAVGTVSWLTLESRSGEQLAGGLVACGVWRVGVTCGEGAEFGVWYVGAFFRRPVLFSAFRRFRRGM